MSRRSSTKVSSLCIPDIHPLRNKVRVAAQEAANERLYWMPCSTHPAFYDRVTGYLRGVGYDLRNLHEARAILEGTDFAAYKSGVALVPQSGSRFQRSGVLFKPLTDKPIRIETVLFVRRDQMHGAVREFVDTVLGDCAHSDQICNEVPHVDYSCSSSRILRRSSISSICMQRRLFATGLVPPRAGMSPCALRNSWLRRLAAWIVCRLTRHQMRGDGPFLRGKVWPALQLRQKDRKRHLG